MRNLMKNRSGEPVLPYLGMYLTDMLFISEANKDYDDDGLINVAKLKRIADVYKLIQSQQQSEFSFPSIPRIQVWIANRCYFSEFVKQQFAFSFFLSSFLFVFTPSPSLTPSLTL
jgi:hypothetical protein